MRLFCLRSLAGRAACGEQEIAIAVCRHAHADGVRESSSKAAMALAAYINEGPPPM
jgi:hypothetical protein